MRLVLYLLITALLSSCSNFNTSNIAPGYRDAFTSISNYLIGTEDQLSSEMIDNIPYASAVLKIGRGPRGLIILESITNDKYNWVSADGIIITTDIYGKIIGTEGLENNLLNLESSYFSLNDADTSNSYTSFYSFYPPRLNLLPVEVSFEFLGEESIELIKGLSYLSRIDEEIKNDTLGWKEVNRYWVDETGFIWKSRQTISPKLPPFYLEVTKKPAM